VTDPEDLVSVPNSGLLTSAAEIECTLTSEAAEWIGVAGASEWMVLAGVAELPSCVVPVSCLTASVGAVGDKKISDLLGLPLRRFAGGESPTVGDSSFLICSGSFELSARISGLMPLGISKSFDIPPGWGDSGESA
jgi:hypothetical protein